MNKGFKEHYLFKSRLLARFTFTLLLLLSVAIPSEGQTGQPAQPVREKSTLEKDPKSVPAQVEKLIAGKQLPAALKLCSEELTRDPKGPNSGQLSILRAKILFSLKKEEEAVRSLDWFIAHSNPSSSKADAYEMLSVYYKGKSNPSAANAYNEKLATEFPAHPASIRSYKAKLQVLLDEKKYEAIITEVNKKGVFNDSEVKKIYDLSFVLNGAASDPATLLTSAREFSKGDQQNVSVQLYETIIKNFPTSQESLKARVELGWLYYASNDSKKLDQAESLWKQVIAMGQPKDPVTGDAMWNMVLLLAGPKFKWQEAADLCKKISGVFPVGNVRNEQAMFMRAWLFWAHKKWPEAKTAFTDLIAVYPSNALHAPIIEYLAEIDSGLNARP